jgi:mRNA interferase HigB
MHVISRKALIDFWEKHPVAEIPLRIWFKKVEQANWKNLAELKSDFPKADYLGNNRVVFDIKGNDFRVIADVVFLIGKVLIRFVGTHAEYDKVDAKNC